MPYPFKLDRDTIRVSAEIEKARRKVTVCIAAACKEKGDFRVVLCTDWQISTAVGSADIMLKQRHLPKGFVILTAGADTEILACKSHISKTFWEMKTIDETNVVASLRSALAQRKREKIDEYIRALLGVSYDDFTKYGKERFPDNVITEAYLNILTMKIDATFVVVGFQMKQFPLLVESDENGVVKLREDYVAIGSGSHLALAALLAREQNETEDMHKTIYRVFEAKRYAEKISTVGKTTTLSVMFPDGTMKRVDGYGKDFLAKKYEEFWPQKIDPKFQIDPKFFDESQPADVS